MNLNWSAIKGEIISDLGDIFDRGTPAYGNIDEGLELFRRLVMAKVGGPQLSGLPREIMPALQGAYREQVGHISPLKALASALEPYLKKLVVVAGLDTVPGALNKTLIPLIKALDLNSALTGQVAGGYPQLNELNLPSFNGSPQYLNHICKAYLTRNKVHESPGWNRIEVIDKLTSVLVVYIYSALKYRNQILLLPELSTEMAPIVTKVSDEQRYLYHFITFGSTTNKIKSQILTSFLLNYIRENQPISLMNIQEGANQHFENNLSSNNYRNIIDQLVHQGKLKRSGEKLISLSAEEQQRINQIQADFEDNRAIFFLFLNDIAKEYSIEGLVSDLFDRLQIFIENNYDIDFSEAYNKGIEIDTDENQVYQTFVQYILSIVPDRDSANLLFKDLLRLSQDSDFLLRISAGKAFANLTNPDRYDQYINEQQRVVYLDTQIVLFALCLNYVKHPEYGNYLFETTEELVSIANESKNIELRVSRHYIQEVAYQLKLALLLIPFEGFAGENLSSNIFYRFYWHLKSNDLLNAEDDTFSDFMSEWFHLEEDDAYDRNFWSIAYSNITSFLQSNELQIEVETLPNYEKSAAVSAIESVLKTDLYSRVRTKHVIENDAYMLCHLCNRDVHQVEPFFLTWDKSFVKFRKKYIEQFKRSEITTFHLFNPARFISHMALTKFKIDPKALTNEFLSLVDNTIQDKAGTFWDSINRFLNIENIGRVKRSRYAQKIKEIVEREFNATEDEAEREKVTDTYESRFELINEYFSSESTYKMHDFRAAILSDEHFELIADIIFGDSPDAAFLPKIVEVIKEFKAKA